jgi:hypothetical protein
MRKLLSRALVPVAVAAALVATAAPSSATSFVPCNTSTTRVCYEETGPVPPQVPLYRAASGTPIASVTATLDIYGIPFDTGTVQVPCITPWVNGAPVDTCGNLGFTLISRTWLVPVVSLASPQPQQFGAVYVCTANLTVLVDNVGLNKFPILSACEDGIYVSS